MKLVGLLLLLWTLLSSPHANRGCEEMGHCHSSHRQLVLCVETKSRGIPSIYRSMTEKTNSKKKSCSGGQIILHLYETRRFINVFTRTRHWSLSWVRWIQSTNSHSAFFEINFNIIPSPTSRPPNGLFRFSD
jgi:hypothetical protein